MNHLAIVVWNKISICVELYGKLLVYQQDIMHFIVEVRVPTLTIILNAERLDLAFVQDSINAGF